MKKYICNCAETFKKGNQIDEKNIPMYKVSLDDKKYFVYKWNAIEQRHCDKLYDSIYSTESEAKNTVSRLDEQIKSYIGRLIYEPSS